MKKPKEQMPRWMFETRTQQWHEAGLESQIQPEKPSRTWPRLLVFSVLIAIVIALFALRHTLFPDYTKTVRVLTAILLFTFGLGFASALGRTVTPLIMRRMNPGTAGTTRFVIRLLTIVIVGVVSLRIAQLNASAIAVGGAFSAVILGLAAQQALGNVFAGIVLQSTRPFQVGQRVRLRGSPIGADPLEGTVSSLGVSYTTLQYGPGQILIPNGILLNAVVQPLHSLDSVDLRARFDSHVTPIEVQDMLAHAITVPILEAPEVWLEEVDRDEVVYRINVTPAAPVDGAKLTEEVVAITRGTFEHRRPDDDPDGDDRPDTGPDASVPDGDDASRQSG